VKGARMLMASAAATLAAACAQGPGGGGPSIAGLWAVAEIDGAAVPPDVPVTVNFAVDGRVSGTSGCNQYGGEYVYRKGVLTIGQTFTTEMACIDDYRMELESKFHNRFSGDLSVSASPDGALLLGAKEAGLVLRKAAS